jgi:hypothetical protein
MLPGLGPAGQAELTARGRREIEGLPREEFPLYRGSSAAPGRPV